jgi:hypothetical protein
LFSRLYETSHALCSEKHVSRGESQLASLRPLALCDSILSSGTCSHMRCTPSQGNLLHMRDGYLFDDAVFILPSTCKAWSTKVRDRSTQGPKNWPLHHRTRRQLSHPILTRGAPDTGGFQKHRPCC